ncbi:hypothetical protein SH2C18_13320 [Clostridium sediminicola]|uniref:ABC transporter ATP-binding protein n=1 Tax=Clostridium sediminicola TaxID=3114879 RepID=UPI0031F1C60C
MEKLKFDNVTMYYKGSKGKPALKNINIQLDMRKYIAFLGPSGCGKSTLLKLINRLYLPTEGEIYIDNENIQKVPVNKLRQKMGYAIQQTGLFPHMNVFENIAVVPKLLNWEDKKIKCRIEELLNLVGLEYDEYSEKYPSELSGGQKQRVGIARALAGNPEVLLMDEPFSALDIITKRKMKDELAKIQNEGNKTLFMVTHDVEEAMRYADTIVLVKDGEIVQCGSPLEFVQSPKDEFVRNFIGCTDIIKKMSIVKVADLLSIGSDGLTKNECDDKNNIKNITEEFVDTGDKLRDVLSIMLEKNLREVKVKENKRSMNKTITWDEIIKFSKKNIVD